MFITLEGIDASGKHTQSTLLHEYFSKLPAEKNVVKLEFPKYDSLTGQMILGHLQGDFKVNLTESGQLKHLKKPEYFKDPATYVFQCLQLVNRMECLPKSLWDNSSKSESIFISDRYNASAYAYGLAFDLDFSWLLKTHEMLPQPDLNIFLDISVEESFNRRPDRRDEYEKNSDLLEKVRKCYLEVFNRLGSSYVILKCSGKSIDEVHKEIITLVKEKCM